MKLPKNQQENDSQCLCFGDYGEVNCLIEPIYKNDMDTLRDLLEKGVKLEDFTHGFDTHTEPEILNLLSEYNALPEGISLPTLQFNLYVLGNRKISFSDFCDKPGLSLNGCPGLQSPIAASALCGNALAVADLIRRGVEERPFGYLFLSSSGRISQSGISYHDFHGFKKSVSETVTGRYEGQCEVAEILLSHPNANLDADISQEKSAYGYTERYLPLFAWAAKEDKAYLLDNPIFNMLLRDADEYSIGRTAIVAATFESKEFLTRAIQEEIFKAKDIAEACSVLAVNGNVELLTDVMQFLEEHAANKNIPTVQALHNEHGAYLLSCAVRNGHYETSEFLLKSGAPPNEMDMHSTPLAVATVLDEIELMKLLIRYGANVNHQDFWGDQTPLHFAADHHLRQGGHNLEALEILITSGADVDLADENGNKALDTIKDKAIQKEIQEFVAQQAATCDSQRSTMIYPPHSDGCPSKASTSLVPMVDEVAIGTENSMVLVPQTSLSAEMDEEESPETAAEFRGFVESEEAYRSDTSSSSFLLPGAGAVKTITATEDNSHFVRDGESQTMVYRYDSPSTSFDSQIGLGAVLRKAFSFVASRLWGEKPIQPTYVSDSVYNKKIAKLKEEAKITRGQLKEALPFEENMVLQEDLDEREYLLSELINAGHATNSELKELASDFKFLRQEIKEWHDEFYNLYDGFSVEKAFCQAQEAISCPAETPFFAAYSETLRSIASGQVFEQLPAPPKVIDEVPEVMTLACGK
jgi:ankyrin repeat protein